LIAAVSLCAGQTKAGSGGFAVFSKVETTTAPTGIDLTVVCTKPVAPAFTQLKDPDRLVIDLPDTLVGNHPQSVPLTGPDVRAMRINQFQKDPPIARIVLDLIGERDYSYEPNGVSFVVHLRGAQAAAKPSQPGVAIEGSIGFGLPQAPARAALVTGNVLPGGAVGGNKVSPGSAITAGGDTAILKLERGGEIRICPGTTASVTPSANGRSIMTGMSEGAVELHYPLAASADTVLTPDFRILLSGPGEFHYAISADPKGNTCVRALQGNTASAVVSELMGDGTYQVKPGEQVVFRAGRLKSTDANVPMECGCPPPRQPQLVAAGGPSGGEAEHTRTLALPPDGSAQPPANSVPPNSSAAMNPQVVVDAPIVFRGSDPPPEISRQVAQLGAGRDPQPAPEVAAAPPRRVKKAKVKKEKEPLLPEAPAVPEPVKPAPAPKPTQPAGPQPTFLGKIKNFFRSIFH
jgi:hypothetical protein